MGKDLHYSIRPYIERALSNHSAVKEIQPVECDEYYAYNIKRNFGMTDVLVVLSDAYYFGEANLESKPKILKNGGFFLIARPEASNYVENLEKERIGIGKLGTLLGALNVREFWTYIALSDVEKAKRKKR